MEDVKNIVVKYIKSEKKIKSSLGEIIIENSYFGEGGNGLVYEGKFAKTECDKTIALKFLTVLQNTKIDRFISDYFNVITLPSNNYTVKYISFDRIKIDEKEIPVILMKKYQKSLDKYRKDIKEFKYDDVEKLFDFLLQSVKFIHDNGIIHRDLKPENILIDENSNYVLADFGIAKFNPKMFHISTKTRNERLNNRLFSAPEQEKNSITPKKSMDIYAIGQILQWFITGDTHRGVGRKSVNNYFENAFVHTIDLIIEKCLNNNPDERFQNISEIEEFIQNSMFIPYSDYLRYVLSFNRVLAYTFPGGANKLNHTNSPDKIEKFLTKLAEIRKYKNCVNKWINGIRYDLNSNPMCFNIEDDKWSNLEITKENNTWLLKDSEIKIQNLWCYYDSTFYNDYVVIQTEPMPSFGVYPKKEFKEPEDKELYTRRHLHWYDYETVGLVDDKYYIKEEEYDYGFAEINGETVELNKHKKSIRTRCLKDMFILFGSKHHTYFSIYLYHENVREITSKFIEEFRYNLSDIENYCNTFLENIKKYTGKHKQFLYESDYK